uniref:unspecific monooxygenase n=1 Tax=Phascolarctos cinereus TaxID=38626 RepID=A0A6P5JQN0_PHACI|nr:cytochrome P450 2C39-like [Phascolarctos cinereus]
MIGNIVQMDLKNVLETLCKLAKEYGPVFTLQLGVKRVVVFHGHKAVKEYLIDHGDKVADKGPMPIFEFISNGLGKFLLGEEQEDKDKNMEKSIFSEIS